MKKIQVTFIEDEYTQYVWVRPMPKPDTGGHKALKNEDFIDHQDIINRNSYYRQITAKRLNERYMKRALNKKSMSQEELDSNKQLGIGKRHTITPVEDKPLLRIPRAEE